MIAVFALCFIFSYTLLRAVILEKDTFETLRWIEEQQALGEENLSDSPADLPMIILLLPVLREQRELPALMVHMSHLLYPRNKLRIFLITTERERQEQDASSMTEARTTIDLAEDLAEALNRKLEHELFSHIHCPDIRANKAGQLNYALSVVDRESNPLLVDQTYIGVYDADSRPDIRTLDYVGADALRHSKEWQIMPPAYQQVSLFIKNFRLLPCTLQGLLLRMEALYQTRWALGYEIPNYRSQYQLLTSDSCSRVERVVKSRLSYCVGHGSFLRLDVLKRIGGFPTHTPVEDISLGNILSFMEIPIKPVPFFDVCEVPESLCSMFHQGSVWFATSMSVFSTIRLVHRRLTPIADWLRVGSLAFQRTCMHISWALGGIIFIMSLLAVLLLPEYLLPLLSLGVVAGLLYSSLGTGTILMFRDRLNSLLDKEIDWTPDERTYNIILILASPCKAVTNCVGPILYALSWITAHTLDQSIEFGKTERDQPRDGPQSMTLEGF